MAASLTNLELDEAAIADYVELTLSLNAGDWSTNNGGKFYVLLEIVDHDDLV